MIQPIIRIAGKSILVSVAVFILLISCAQQNENAAPTIHLISSEASLPILELPFSKVSILNEPIYFVETNNGLIISNFSKSQFSLFKSPDIGEDNLTPQLIFQADLDSMNLVFCAMLTEKDGIAFGDFCSFFYHFTLNDSVLSFKKIKLPKRYDAPLQDSIQLTIDRSVGDRPFIRDNEVIFHVYQLHTKQPNSMRIAFEAIYRAPLFLSYSMAINKLSVINLTLDKLGLEYDSIHLDDFVRSETRFGVGFTDDEHFFACSEKSEHLWWCNKNGDTEKSYTYTYAQNEPDFKITTIETGKGPQYITASAFYTNQWYIQSSNKLIRQLKRGNSDESQIGQNETPWQLLILDLEGDRIILETILNFEPAHFNYGDVHFIDDRYMLISNSGINNNNYDPNNHSYTIIDLSEYLK